jgi:exosortase/archaeosortase family protein
MVSSRFSPDGFVVTRNFYIGATAVIIMFAALFSTSLPGRDFLSAGLHAVVDFKVMWLCALIATWRIASSSTRQLRSGDVIWGGSLAALAAVTAGLWPWLFLSAFAAVFLARTGQHRVHQALCLLFAIAAHETVVTLCGEFFADILLSLDALIAQLLTHWFMPEVLVSGATLQGSSGHSVVLVWGCSSLSYVGDMMLLCWALALLLAGDGRLDRGLWTWLLLVAGITITLNSMRVVLMATDPQVYHLLHEGAGAMAFRITLLAGAVGVAWLQSSDAISRSRCVA